MRYITMSAIIDVEGIGEVFAEKLKEAGIATTAALLKEGATPSGRKRIEKAAGIGHKQILRWTNHVDLYRIKGVQKQYAELLEAAGVDSIPELGQRDPTNLLAKIIATNEKKNLVRKLPTPNRSPIGSHRPRSCPEL
jgi:predicted flap endonuclease-1-like 5' DNA nuclease